MIRIMKRQVLIMPIIIPISVLVMDCKYSRSLLGRTVIFTQELGV